MQAIRLVREVGPVVRRGRRTTTIVLSIVTLASCLLVVAPRTVGYSTSKVDLARLVVKQLAYEAFPAWSASHPERPCPASIGELAEYVSSDVSVDPWGHPYLLSCGADVPARACGGFAVRSAGEDQRAGTADDINSWE